jgi:hypothetical protein
MAAVTSTGRGQQISFRVARPDQVGDVLSLLDEAAAWLQARGVSQRPARFEPSWVEGAISRAETWLAGADGVIGATVTLDWADRVWDGTPGSAAYLHRMAVCRRAAGLGAVILA